MAPQLVEFDFTSDGDINITNAAWSQCGGFESVVVGEEVYDPRLLLILPIKPKPSLVFDPPPQVA